MHFTLLFCDLVVQHCVASSADIIETIAGHRRHASTFSTVLPPSWPYLISTDVTVDSRDEAARV